MLNTECNERRIAELFGQERHVWVYSSAVERLTADQQVPGSNPGVPFRNHFPACPTHLDRIRSRLFMPTPPQPLGATQGAQQRSGAVVSVLGS
jgi:hypothetical protein